jgi:hypothetical protein
METGFLAGGGIPKRFAVPIITWIQGLYKRGWWYPVKDIEQRLVLPVTTFRCVACGYLELYAPGERKKKNEDGV